MLFDPRWNKKPKGPSFSEPSLEGFALFVALQIMRDPDGEYYWRCTYECAVGQYLRSLGLWHDWYKDSLRGGLLADLDEFARGEYWRDRHGRFTRYENAVWFWRDLHKRLQAICRVKKESAIWHAVAA